MTSAGGNGTLVTGVDSVPGARVVVVGAGFVGAEVASTAVALGAHVTMVEAAPVPFAATLGPEVGGLLAERWRAHGVELRAGVSVAAVHARALELTDGSTLAFDAALVAVGVAPAAELLPGLRGPDGGVRVDACGRTEVRGVYACGDAASFAGRRVEHWTSAAGQAVAVARAIAGRPVPYLDPPYFWSDQFGLRLQHVDAGRAWARVELDGDSGSFSARYLAADGRLAAALVANRPHEVAALRREVAALPLAA